MKYRIWILGGLAGLVLAACAPRSPARREARTDPIEIVDTTAFVGNFHWLQAAVSQAGLDDVLRGGAPLTVFVPTDQAFNRLSPSLLNNLFKPKHEATLRRIVSYHMVPENLLTGDLTRRSRLPTLNGMHLTVWANQRGVMLDNARLIRANVRTDNAVIHVIDRVLVPHLEELPLRNASTPSAFEMAPASRMRQEPIKASMASGTGPGPRRLRR